MSQIIQGDCLKALRELPTHSVDSIITDPPAGISFMGKDWDSSKGGRDQWVSWLAEIMTEARRVLKPGGHALVWSIPRTSHWTALALENAGFEIRDCISHIFGSGMPKSLNVSKAIDQMAGVERPVIAIRKDGNKGGGAHTYDDDNFTWPNQFNVTAPATSDAQAWDGWGTGLKPAHETWILARSPLAEDTIAANVLEYGTGAINIDACRIGSESTIRVNHTSGIWSSETQENVHGSNQGRWPANLILSHTLFCQPDKCAEGCPVAELDRQSGKSRNGEHIRHTSIGVQGYHGNTSAFEVGGYSDQGGASRYFAQFYYCPKPSQKERNAGCQDLPPRAGFDKNSSKVIAHINHNTGETTYSEYTPSSRQNNHPTVKPKNLMKYLVKLVTPPGGVVLDPFAGSGTTGLACAEEGFEYILIEREPEYIEIIRTRIAHAEKAAA